MITRQEALHIVLQSAHQLPIENVQLMNSLGRVLAEDVISDMNMPPFDKSAYDGFACRKEDLPQLLKMIEIIPAGKVPEKTIGKGECAKIMTGAPMPEGADCVIPVEDTEMPDSETVKCNRIPAKSNISYRAEDVKLGQKVMDLGIVITAKHIAVLASMGYADVAVYKKVKVGIISTGSELVEPAFPPAASQIRNSNGYQLYGQLLEIGCEPNYIGIVEDDEKVTFEAIKKGIAENDVLLLTGGVSMGDFDFIPQIFKDLGVEIKFESVAIQPGKPSTFGVAGQKIVFGLPGNPVSSFVVFEILAKPMLLKMMGNTSQPLNAFFPMAKEYFRKKTERESWLPIRINDQGEIESLDYHGSAHINSLTFANGLISIPLGIGALKKGELVHVRFI